MPRSQTNKTALVKRLRSVWDIDYVMPILGILNGDIGITNVHDFTSIFLKLAEVLIAAESLDALEHSLTVALLARAVIGEMNEMYQAGKSFLP